MNKKKVPMRKCVITNERYEKKNLLRIVKTPEGEVIFDKTGKANGRGAYVSKSKNVILKAQKSKALARHLENEIPDSIYMELLKEVNDE